MKVFYYSKGIYSKRAITVLDITPIDILNNNEIINHRLDQLINLIIPDLPDLPGLQSNRIDIYLDEYRMIALTFKTLANKKVYEKELEVIEYSFSITSQQPSLITLKLIDNGL